ncbi:purple acid phosphatase 18 [Wolffia australiana]
MDSSSSVVILVLALFSVSSLAMGIGGEDYVRPPPRDTLISPIDRTRASSDPQQVHVSLAGSNHMRITWITPRESPSSSVVNYGKSSRNYTSISKGESSSYSFIFYKSGNIHHVVIGPLEDNTVYYYQCGQQGPEFRLKTPPAQFPVTFTVSGDMGQTGWTSSTLDHMKNCEYDVHLLPGDLSYADYQQNRWDSFGDLVEPLASSRPWMVTQGNHEKEYMSFLVSEFRAFNARWRMPFEESGSPSNLFYSFDVAGAHVIMLASYADYGGGSQQMAWLKADLAKVNRKRTPWLLALFHVPWYNSNRAHQGEGDGMRASMEPFLTAAGVDLILAGHVHAYERTERIASGRLDPCGAVHITIGDGGNREGLATRYLEPKPRWSAFREASFGHGELQIMNETHALWSWHRNDDDEPVLSDHVWITSLAGSGCLLSTHINLSKFDKISTGP